MRATSRAPRSSLFALVVGPRPDPSHATELFLVSMWLLHQCRPLFARADPEALGASFAALASRAGPRASPLRVTALLPLPPGRPSTETAYHCTSAGGSKDEPRPPSLRVQALPQQNDVKARRTRFHRDHPCRIRDSCSSRASASNASGSKPPPIRSRILPCSPCIGSPRIPDLERYR